MELVGKGGAAPKVSVCNNNTYVFAFTNFEGKLFKLTDERTKVHPDATLVGLNGNYNTLVGGATNLPQLKLGKFGVAEAAATLWNHNKKKPFKDDELKKDLVIMSVVVC